MSKIEVQCLIPNGIKIRMPDGRSAELAGAQRPDQRGKVARPGVTFVDEKLMRDWLAAYASSPLVTSGQVVLVEPKVVDPPADDSDLTQADIDTTNADAGVALAEAGIAAVAPAEPVATSGSADATNPVAVAEPAAAGAGPTPVDARSPSPDAETGATDAGATATDAPEPVGESTDAPQEGGPDPAPETPDPVPTDSGDENDAPKVQDTATDSPNP